MATVMRAASRGPALFSVSSLSASFAISTTVLRFLQRKRSDSRLGPDDHAVVAASVVGLVGTIFSIVEASKKTSSGALEFNVLGQPWLMTGAALSEISICLSFIRTLSARRWKILLATLISLIVILNILFSLTSSLQCRPLEKLWKPQADGSCWHPSVRLNLEYVQGTFSVLSWFFLSLFPLLTLRELDTQRHPRWSFYVLSSLTFALGILATARTYETSRAAGLGVYSFDTFCGEVLALLEQNIGIVAANVLPIGAFLSRTARNEAALRYKSSSQAESSRSIIRAISRASFRRGGTSSSRSSLEDPKLSMTHELEAGSIRNVTDPYGDPEAWRRGIVKTVSVEIVEEDNPDAEVPKGTAGGAISGKKEAGVEQDWETILRGGPEASRT